MITVVDNGIVPVENGEIDTEKFYAAKNSMDEFDNEKQVILTETLRRLGMILEDGTLKRVAESPSFDEQTEILKWQDSQIRQLYRDLAP